MQYCCSYNNSNKKSKLNLSLNYNKYHRNPHFKTSNVRSIRLLMALMPICVFYKYYNTVQIVLLCTIQIVVVLWNYYFVYLPDIVLLLQYRVRKRSHQLITTCITTISYTYSISKFIVLIIKLPIEYCWVMNWTEPDHLIMFVYIISI